MSTSDSSFLPDLAGFEDELSFDQVGGDVLDVVEDVSRLWGDEIAPRLPEFVYTGVAGGWLKDVARSEGPEWLQPVVDLYEDATDTAVKNPLSTIAAMSKGGPLLGPILLMIRGGVAPDRVRRVLDAAPDWDKHLLSMADWKAQNPSSPLGDELSASSTSILAAVDRLAHALRLPKSRVVAGVVGLADLLSSHFLNTSEKPWLSQTG